MNGSPRMLARLQADDPALPNPAHDFRGWEVVDRDGAKVGGIVGLIIDEELRRVRFLEIDSGETQGDVRSTQLVPIDVVERVGDGTVHISPDPAKVASGPNYYADVVPERPYYAVIYSYYDCPPFWWAGYAYPELGR